MNTVKNNKLILKAIKDFYSFEKDTEFADFLGVAKTTLSSWYIRGKIDYDLVYAKCVDIDGNFLLSGTGQIQRPSKKYIANSTVSFVAEPDESSQYGKKDTIDALKQTIKAQEITIKTLSDLIQLLKSQLEDTKAK